jgi:UDP-N-acetylglucosamine 2-epimerase (non-hydrolysing)
MLAFEPVCIQEKPDAVVVVGDVNATLACALVARKLNIPVAHVEAGLRSGDMTMPEEINRIMTDAISDWLFVTEESALSNLQFEGRLARAHLVGHTMIDNLLYEAALLDSQPKGGMMSEEIVHRLTDYAVVTLHRPSNVDDRVQLAKLMAALGEVAVLLPVVFVAHPRTAKNLTSFKVEIPAGVEMVPPLPYREFLNLWKSARVVLTDSGGLQEETTALGIPCLTLRDTTERPITVDEGTNIVVGQDLNRIVGEVGRVLAGKGKAGKRPAIWDGNASRRIVSLLCDQLRDRAPAA